MFAFILRGSVRHGSSAKSLGAGRLWRCVLAIAVLCSAACGNDEVLQPAGGGDSSKASNDGTVGSVDGSNGSDAAATPETDAEATPDAADAGGAETIPAEDTLPAGDSGQDGGAADADDAVDGAVDGDGQTAEATGDADTAIGEDGDAATGANDGDAAVPPPDTDDTGDNGGTGGDADGSAVDSPDSEPQCTKPESCPQPKTACQQATCVAGVCGIASAADGSECSDDNQCTAGETCTAGICGGGKAKSCDDANPCTSDACDPANGVCSSSPNAAPCDDGNACTNGDACKSGACAGEAAIKCDDGNPCTNDSCDPAKGCTATDNTQPCGGDDKCLSNAVCKGGKCQGNPVACDDGNPCTKDACDSKSGCIASAIGGVPCDDGSLCTEGDLCTDGKCAPGKAKVCDDGNACSDDSCDPKTGCAAKDNTASCDDGNKCTDKDTCGGGKCNPGAKVECDDGNPCTTDSCDPAKGCAAANNTLPCTLGTACDQGVCKDGKCASTGQKSCDDGNPCTTDTCDAIKGCLNAAVADATVCGKGDLCVADSACKAGKCEPGAKTNCDDKNPCTDDVCDPKAGCGYFPNSAACDDGNKCTVGDKCAVVTGQGAKCVSGAPLDPKTACDDKNVCTADTCDPVKGCTNGAVAGTPACDDGNICTTGETCAGGKCQGGKLSGCDDGNQCTADNCDPATGNCSWTGVKGACDDKNGCTSNDQCVGIACQGTATVCDDKDPCTTDSCDKASGKCVTAPLNSGACDDGNLCTTGDACAAGKCAGKAATCDDGNLCTDDACDPKTGKCSATNNSASCGGADLCTTGGACKDGKCQAGTTPKCDDKNPCSVDKCDAATGKCSYAPAADGTACDDGIACTSASACKQGICAAPACSLYSNSFECNKPLDFAVDVPAPQLGGQPRKVIWAVDQTPATPDAAAKGCTLNFNDGTDYCDPLLNQCQLPKGTAKSPVVDFSTVPTLMPSLVMDIYYDVDIQNGQYAGWDAPKITLRNAATGAELANWVLPVTNADIKVWKNGYKIDMPQAKGLKVTVDFSVNLPFNFPTDQGNAGAGIFVDNLSFQAGAPLETACNDGVDNDGNGKTDCADTACQFGVLCYGTAVASDDMACTSKNWTSAANQNSVVWAVDGTPASVVPKTGACTLNFNDGTDYQPGNGQNPSAGAASWATQLDLSAYKAATALFWTYQDVEGAGGNCQNNCSGVDRLMLQVSSDNFAGCPCGANQSCSYANNLCNTANTTTYLIAKDTLKAWVKNTVDLSKFAGKKVNLRFRFDSIDNITNNLPGAFIDDFVLLAL